MKKKREYYENTMTYLEKVKRFILCVYGVEQLKFFDLDLDYLACQLGSFIEPKLMIEYLTMVNRGNNVSKARIHNKVLNVYHITHRFSFKRLLDFINDPGSMI